MKQCACSNKQKYEFLFISDHHKDSGRQKIYKFDGDTALKALHPYRSAIGNFWAVEGFRKVGSKRWNKCYVKAWATDENWWPYKS